MILTPFVEFISSLLVKNITFWKNQRTRWKEFFESLKGNAKVMTLSEPAWAIPLTWVWFYLPLYMKELKLSTFQIGIVVATGVIMQAICSLIGGIVADRFSHKKILIIFDTLGWPVSMIFFFFSKNFFHLILATVINNLCMIVGPSWHCILIEGSPENKRTNIYAFYQIIFNLSTLLIPIAGLIIKKAGIITGCRIIFAITALTTSCGIIARWLFLKDTKLSIRNVKKKEQHNFSLFSEIDTFFKAFNKIPFLKSFLWFIVAQTLVWFGLTMRDTYSSIFLTSENGLELSAATISILPFITAIIMIVVMLFFIPHIKEKNFKIFIILGLLFTIISTVLYPVAPKKILWLMAIAASISGAGNAFFRPLTDAYNVNAVPEKIRPRILSILNTMIICITIPAAPIAGKLFTFNPRLVFIFSSLIFTFAFLIVLINCKFEIVKNNLSKKVDL